MEPVSCLGDDLQIGYTYTPLPTHVPTIRCLQFLAPTPNGELCPRLTTCSLEEVDGQYDAVSYTCGTEDASNRIWINGKQLFVRPNIWNSLNRYQTKGFQTQPLGLWIDFICINQIDMAEKNIQVMQMGKVFE